ncbi:hypothetical protein PFISCL1PPCAC_23432, partial [Pristionchus fissidentatus]
GREKTGMRRRGMKIELAEKAYEMEEVHFDGPVPHPMQIPRSVLSDYKIEEENSSVRLPAAPAGRLDAMAPIDNEMEMEEGGEEKENNEEEDEGEVKREAINIDALWRDFMTDYTAGVGIEMADEIIHNIATDPDYVEAVEEGEEDGEQLFYDHFVNQIEMNTVTNEQSGAAVSTLYDFVKRKSVLRRLAKEKEQKTSTVEKKKTKITVDNKKTKKGMKETQKKGVEKGKKGEKTAKAAVPLHIDNAVGRKRNASKRKICHDAMVELGARVRRATNSSLTTDALLHIASSPASPDSSPSPSLPSPSLAQSNPIILSRPSTSVVQQLQQITKLPHLGDPRQMRAAAATTASTDCYDPRRVHKKPPEMEFVQQPPDYDGRSRLVCGPIPMGESLAEVITQFASLKIASFVFTRFEGNVYAWLKAANDERALSLVQWGPFRVGHFSASIHRPGTILVEVNGKVFADYLSLVLSRFGQVIGIEKVGEFEWKATFLDYKEALQAKTVGMEKVNGGYTVKYTTFYAKRFVPT